MLVIHNNSYLTAWGSITTYNEKAGRCIPDLDTKDLQKGVCSASTILKAMGSPAFGYEHEANSEVTAALREQTRAQGMHRNDDYSGTFDLPYVGIIEIEKQPNFRDFLDAVFNIVDKQLHNSTVIGKVEELFKGRNLDVKILDFQAMHAGLLSPKEFYAEDREIAIKQCADPTFWHTLLTTGKLYNKEIGKFTDPIQEKYPMAVELFKTEK